MEPDDIEPDDMSLEADPPSIVARVEALEVRADDTEGNVDGLSVKYDELQGRLKGLVESMQHDRLRFQMDARAILREAKAMVRNGQALRKEVAVTNAAIHKLLREGRSKKGNP